MPRLLALAGALAVAAAAGCGGAAEPSVPRQDLALRLPASAPPPSPARTPTAAATPVVPAGDGDLHPVRGTSAVSGPGERTTYVVEVEGGLGVDAVAFARDVERTLADPRSWGSAGRRGLQRVPGGDADLRVALASPRTTDRLCAPLDTGGRFSCANGERAVLNAARWLRGAPAYGRRLADYRAYLVNHEVGHALGHGHARCPGAGQRAPVMLQQTKGLDGCAPGPWPYP